MKCIIIDDEPLAVDVIETYLQQIDGMEVVAKTNNPLEAITLLNTHKVDLIFLDIEMPNLKGIDLVKTIENLPQIIFTTAYPEYALEGFNLNATDYLVKPIPFHRFLKAVSRAKEKHKLTHDFSVRTTPSAGIQETKPVNNFIFVKSEYENIKINTADINYIQGLKDYIKIYTKNSTKVILTLMSFKEVLSRLPSNNFMRIHRSYIVNIDEIKSLQKTKLIIAEERIPIGETYKVAVLKRLGVS